MTEFGLVTDRLLLRDWRDRDRDPFAAMNADPEVMEFFPSTITRPQSDALVDHFDAESAARGYCPWAVELLDTATFIGFVGLHAVPAVMPFAPAVEVGWRLARPSWGNGFATEAAAAVLRYGFASLGLPEVVSFTATLNERSQRVMARIGMTHDETNDFAHPALPEGHRLGPHVLYRRRREMDRRRAPEESCAASLESM